MNTQEKSKALAQLMGWHLGKMRNGKTVILDGFPVRGVSSWVYVEPYASSLDGLAQFAAILLKYPKAIMQYAYDRDESKWLSASDGEMFHGEPTQESLLNEVLRMNEVLK